MFKDLFKKSSIPSLVENQVLSGTLLKHDLNFGLNHALPDVTHPFIRVKELDVENIKKPRINSAWGIMARDQVWKENMGNFKIQIKSSEAVSLDSMLNTNHYEDLLKLARNSGKSKDLYSFISENTPKVKDKYVQPPWYDKSTNLTMMNKVKGRILNRVSGGYAVGISGIVAFLPKEYYNPKELADQIRKKSSTALLKKSHLGSFSSNYQNIDRDNVYDFYVVLARYDHLLRPEIVVSTFTPREESKTNHNDKKKEKRTTNMLNLVKIIKKKS